jgi:hypothetical protein
VCVCVCGWKWHLQIVISSSGKEKYRVEESAGGVLTKYGHERQQPSSDPIQQLRNVGSIHPHTALLAMAYFKTPTGASITHKKKKKKLRRWWWFFVLLEIRISSDRGRDKESVRTCVHHALWKNKMADGRYYFNPLASSKAGAAREITVFLNGTCLMSDEYNKDTHVCVTNSDRLFLINWSRVKFCDYFKRIVGCWSVVYTSEMKYPGAIPIGILLSFPLYTIELKAIK